MATQKFKSGDKVKFTQEAKDRYSDGEYRLSGTWERLDLNGIYTIKKQTQTGNCRVEELEASLPSYLLELAETEKKMTKKDFILALIQAIFWDQDLTYEGCKPYAKVHTKMDTIIVKCPKYYGKVELTLSPIYGNFEETDIKPVTEFLKQNCDLDYPESSIKVDNGDLVMCFTDYPWHMVDEIKPGPPEEPVQEDKPSSCDTCEVVRKLQAEIQRLKYELDQAKAEKPQTDSDPCKKPKVWATITFEF